MEKTNEPAPEDFANLHDHGGEPAAEVMSGRVRRRRSASQSQKRKLWIWIGSASHLAALAILGFILWYRYQPASEPEEKGAKPAFKMTRKQKIDDGGSRLEKRGPKIEDRGSETEKNRSRSAILDPPSSNSPMEPEDIVGEIRTLMGHSDTVVSLAFFPDGRHALSGSYDGSLRIWDLETGQELRTLGKVAGKIMNVAVSPDGHYALSAGEDRLVHLWDVESVENGKELAAFQGHLSYITTVAFSADGRYALSGGHDQVLRFWDVEAQKALPVTCRHAGLIRGVAFDPSSESKEKELRALSCSSEDGTMRLWNVRKGRELHRWKPPQAAAWSVAWGKGSRALVGSSDGMVRLWDVASWRELRSLPGHRGAVTSVAISPDGRRALTGSEDRTIRLWDLETGEELRRFTRETIVASVAFSPDGRRALSGEFDTNVHLWGLPK